jgi:hypothetical protein
MLQQYRMEQISPPHDTIGKKRTAVSTHNVMQVYCQRHPQSMIIAKFLRVAKIPPYSMHKTAGSKLMSRNEGIRKWFLVFLFYGSN